MKRRAPFDHAPAISCGARCHGCPLEHKLGPVYGVPATNTPAFPFDILLVPERPGDVEVNKREPLAGRSGRVVDKVLREFGIFRNQVSTSNATLCTQREYIQPRLWNQAIMSCQGRLLSDIRTAKKPGRKLLVMLLGAKALKAVFKDEGISAWRGFPIEPKYEAFKIPDVVYFPTWHPSAILREPWCLPVWVKDWARGLGLVQGAIKPFEWPHIWTGNTHEVKQILTEIHDGKHPRVGFDIETAGKEPLIAPIICMGFGTKDWGISYPVFDKRADPECLDLTRAIFQKRSIELSVQNGNHDIVGVEARGYGHVQCRVIDILNIARTRFPQLDHDLQSVASFLHFIEKWKLVYRADKGDEDWAEALEDESKLAKMMPYNAKDAIGTDICVDPLLAMLGEAL